MQNSNLSYANASKASFEAANLEGSNLHRATLCGAKLEKASLKNARLTNTNLNSIKLNIGSSSFSFAIAGLNIWFPPRRDYKSSIIGLILVSVLNGIYKTQQGKTNLQGAELSGTNLRDAQLKGADLSNANLSHANLIKTDIQGANLKGVSIDGAILSLDFTIPGGLTDQQILGWYKSIKEVRKKHSLPLLRQILLSKGLIGLEESNPELMYPDLDSIESQ